jgi:hypothetical protein
MNTATLTSPVNTLVSAGQGPVPFTLTADQNAALQKLNNFLVSPIETAFVLQGYSGCGKSTLIRTLLDKLPSFMKTAKLIQPSMKEFTLQLTATTNKAAENLAQISGEEVLTIHAFLGLRVQTDYKTNTTTLVPKNKLTLANFLIVIDEASQIDSELLRHIFSRTKDCKVIFVGDPAQLVQVGATKAVVFESKFPGAALTEVVRQAKGNPIVTLSTQFRNTVNTGHFFQFKPDGHHIQYLDRDAFNQEILTEFCRPDWRYKDSKVLAWTNKCVIGYNNLIRANMAGDPAFVVGDYAVCNSFLSVGRKTVKTDQLVQITEIVKAQSYDVPGAFFTLDHDIVAFMPVTLEARNTRIKQARAADQIDVIAAIEQNWVDLRAASAQTINKSQGSTYNKVFIDLDDVSRCNSGDQIARMLYVGVSRAKDHVYLTGDFT